LAQLVSPPNGGISTARRVVIAGGSSRNGLSVCQPRAERLVLGVGQELVAQEQHLVAVERLLELFERLVAEVRQAHADHLRAHRGGERPYLEVVRLEGVVVEIARRGNAHFPHGFRPLWRRPCGARFR
jgi:hypothetical protein